ncbi:SGNH/GDSL hydrolase family protein [Dactylosporangium sp. CS-047395]|uniref:SGNH/GDSL hydrolase family protein n=1 Tax=Dactylosporangium sp. CS-047395 TaxID=3239936 RepID=UPI003D8AAA09
MKRATTTLLAAALTILAGCSGDPAPAGSPEPSPTPPGGPVVRILPLGDSITDGRKDPGSYRIELWKELTASGVRLDFVGSKQSGPSSLPDRDHEGHSGFRIDEIDAEVTGWVQAADPRFVLVQLGTNDVLQDYQMAGAPERMSKLLDHVIAAAPGADVYVASLLPLEDKAQQAHATAFNAALPEIVRDKGARVHFVDMHDKLTLKDLDDGIHPTAGGFVKMAQLWADALKPQLTAAPVASGKAPQG